MEMKSKYYEKEIGVTVCEKHFSEVFLMVNINNNNSTMEICFLIRYITLRKLSKQMICQAKEGMDPFE